MTPQQRRQHVEDACAAIILAAGKPSPSTTSPPAPDSAEPPSTAIRRCAPSSKNTAPAAGKHTPSGLTTEIAHLRTALDAIATTVRRHEEELRRLRKPQRHP